MLVTDKRFILVEEVDDPESQHASGRYSPAPPGADCTSTKDSPSSKSSSVLVDAYSGKEEGHVTALLDSSFVQGGSQ